MGLLQRLFGKNNEPPPPQPKAPPEPPRKAPEPPAETKQKEKPNESPPPPTKAPQIPIGASILGVPVDTNDRLFIPPHLRNRHLYLIGKTRTGKTTLIKNLALQDMAAGYGLCFVDPHGDAALDLIGCIPENRRGDVIYFDPSSVYAPAFNLFRLPYPAYKITEDFISCLKLFFDSWGQRLEHLLRHALLTLLQDKEPHSLRDLRLLLTSQPFRDEVTARVQDPDLQEFWNNEFPHMSKDATSPIVNRLSAFLAPGSPMQRIFSQRENDLDFWRLMNEQKILIVNLAKGILGDEGSRLLGGMLVTAINQSAMARAELPPEQRKIFVMYLDEFQNFAVDSMASVLSESAKYQLYLSLAHQTLGQVSPMLRACIFGNVASMVAFGISADDASTMRREMHRSRFMYRENGGTIYQPLENLLNKEKDMYQRLLKKSEEHWQAKVNCQVMRDRAKKNHNGKQLEDELTRIDLIEKEYKSDPLQDIAHCQAALRKLDTPDLNSSILNDIFHGSRHEFRQLDYPDVDDFINLQPRHAFARIERAENVTLFQTLAAPEPEPAARDAILTETRRAFEARQQQRAKEAPPRIGLDTQAPAAEEQEAASTTAQPKKPQLRVVPKTPPKTDEDFSF
jgi:hypothetical protein